MSATISTIRHPSSGLRVVLIKPSKYAIDGYTDRYWRGFMPNSTLNHMQAMTEDYQRRSRARLEIFTFDEYVQLDLDYLKLLNGDSGPTLVALLGVQSHQFHRALDLAALAIDQGAQAIVGGPHAMTCDTTEIQQRGVSFALAEAELIWDQILQDAAREKLQPVYGADQRWQRELEPPVLTPPTKKDLKRYVAPMLGIYPARGCPFLCNFCSVIKIAGRNVRAQSVETTIETLLRARRAGVRVVMFTSDNFNKTPAVRELLEAMISEQTGLPFFAQCDTQIGSRDADLIPLMAKAGCYQIFIGVESFSRSALTSARKFQNHPDRYAQIVELCERHGILTHFSNIIGFPGDTGETVKEHLETLRSMNPSLASFYILTPIPGTEQYGDFLARGLIYESNLDRFDGIHPTWHHDHFSPRRLQRLLFDCYRNFFGYKEFLGSTGLAKGTSFDFDYLGTWLFTRLQAYHETHPMSGGVWRVKRDHQDDYLQLRQKTFGVRLLPLPDNLELSAEDADFNRRAKLG